MRHRTLCFAVQIVLLLVIVPAAEGFGSKGPQGKSANIGGSWKGTYTSGSGSGGVSFVFTKAAKAGWRGSIAWSNEEGEQKADLGSIQLTGDKLKCTLESPDGQASVAVEGQVKGDQFDGTYSVYRKGTTDLLEKGSWKVTRVK